ncbi:MAG: potassium-transporting ATPase subunit C [Isosphaeraceae bacterium]
MIRETIQALVVCLITFVGCSVVYPATVWALAHLAFPYESEGSLLQGRDRSVIGSELIAQPFASERYFASRPSAVNYKADATGGSNLGGKNPALREQFTARAGALQATTENPAPTDLVMASGSGVDPHIRVESAHYQVSRVAAARGVPAGEVRSLVDRHVERSGAILGAPPRINVLRLNLALDETWPAARPARP